MNGHKITNDEVREIIRLRKLGHSLPEIMAKVNRGSSTVFKYAKNVAIDSKYLELLRIKQGGSKKRSIQQWIIAQEKARKLIGETLDSKSRILIAAALYWGEGAKKDFSLTNSDPRLIKTFINFLKDVGIEKDQFRITLRIYEDLEEDKAIQFWSKLIGTPKKQILNVNVLQGKKGGKLKYGMCRIRVTKGGPYLKLIQSIIELITLKSGTTPS